MPKQQRRPRNIARQRVRGRGDYEVTVPATGKLDAVKLSHATNDLDARLRKLEVSAPSEKGKAYREIGEDLGSKFGFGGMGKKAGAILSTLMGHGDYHVNTNSLMPGKMPPSGAGVPVFSKDGRRGVRITEREYIGDVLASGAVVNGATAFDLRSFRINPGLNSTFPWLSAIASQFEQWEPLGIVFEFISTSAEYSGTGQALGTVVMATDYDNTDAIFTNKIQMENEDYSNSTRCATSCMHGVECDPKERSERIMYIRSSSNPTGTVIADYDLGNFQIATQGLSATGVNVGELWVSYDVVFYKKNMVGGQVGGNVLGCTIVSTAGITNSVIFGTNPTVSGSLYVTASTAGVLTFPRWLQTGKYLVYIFWTGSAVLTSGPNSTLTNCVAINTDTTSASGSETVSAASSANYALRYTISITGPSATIAFGTATLPTSCTFMRVVITQLPASTPMTAITSDTS